MKKREQVKARGTARVKKFNSDQDETKDTPVEVVEREFDLTQEQLDEVRKGKKVEIINGEIKVKE